MKLERGMKVSCQIAEGGGIVKYINSAKIQIEGGVLFVCQNYCDGARCQDTLGYKYSRILNDTVTDLKVLPLTLDTIFKGCEIVDPYRNKSVILGRIEDVIFMKYKGSIGLLTKTIEQLKHSLYTVVSPEPEPEPTKREKIMDMLKRINDTIAVPDHVKEQIADEILALDEV